MCFGSTWSLTSLAVLGISGIITLSLGADIRITAPIIFLALKEWIQYESYKVLDTCNEKNKWLTVLSWVHISWQPFFLNMFFSYFAPNQWREYKFVLMLCIIYAICNMVRIKELRYNGITSRCSQTEKHICQPKTCSYPGVYHMAYGFELQSADTNFTIPSLFTYALLSFAPVFILGPRILGLLNLLVVIFAFAITHKGSRDGEMAAIWCLNSFWLAIVGVYAVSKK